MIPALLAALFEFYFALGAIFAIAFALRGVERVDPVAKGASWGFRLLILPGAAAFWPLLLGRWLRASGGAR